MKNYSPNRNTPSRSFYINELKKTSDNFKKRNGKLDFLENKLDKLLIHTFNFFHPFFKDDENEVDMNYYKTETNLDKEFDQTVEKHLPKWFLIIIDFFNKIFNRFIGDKTVQNTIIKARKAVNGFYNTISNKQIFKSRKFFAFKSPP